MHSWKNLWKFRFHCICTDQLSSTWTATWTCRGKNEFAAHGYTVNASTYVQEEGKDVTLTSHYENLSQLPPKYNCNVASNYSVSLQYKGWIVDCVWSHVLYTWPSTETVTFFSFSLLHCIDGILFYSLGIRIIPFMKLLLLSAFLHLWFNWSFLNTQLSIYLSAL